MIHFDENTVVEVVDLNEEEIYVEGERLTEELAEKRAAEVLAKAQAMNLRPGGKSLSGNGSIRPSCKSGFPSRRGTSCGRSRRLAT